MQNTVINFIREMYANRTKHPLFQIILIFIWHINRFFTLMNNTLETLINKNILNLFLPKNKPVFPIKPLNIKFPRKLLTNLIHKRDL